MTNLGISFLWLRRLGRGLQPYNGLSAVWNDHKRACLIIAPVLQKRGTTWRGDANAGFHTGNRSSGIGFAWNSFLHCLAIHRANLLAFLSAGAIGRNSSSRIHLPVELRKKHESDSGLQAWSAG